MKGSFILFRIWYNSAGKDFPRLVLSSVIKCLNSFLDNGLKVQDPLGTWFGVGFFVCLFINHFPVFVFLNEGILFLFSQSSFLSP